MREHADGKYQLLPSLTDEEFEHLKLDIQERGVLVPIEFDEDGNILDGHHRYAACKELGIVEYPFVIREGLTESEKRSHARTLNVARRHLSREQKRWMIADELRENPTKSNKSIAGMLGVSDVTVASVRTELNLDNAERVGSDGKTYKGLKEYKNETFSYKIVFDTKEDLTEWIKFLRKIKKERQEKTIGKRVINFIKENE